MESLMETKTKITKKIKLEIRDLTKYYGKKAAAPALDHVSFDVYEGEFANNTLEGKGKMTAGDFARGRKIALHDILE